MRLCIQRVNNASVTVADEVVAKIGKGLLVLVGIERTDTIKEVRDNKCIRFILNEKINIRIEYDVISISPSP